MRANRFGKRAHREEAGQRLVGAAESAQDAGNGDDRAHLAAEVLVFDARGEDFLVALQRTGQITARGDDIGDVDERVDGIPRAALLGPISAAFLERFQRCIVVTGARLTHTDGRERGNANFLVAGELGKPQRTLRVRPGARVVIHRFVNLAQVAMGLGADAVAIQSFGEIEEALGVFDGRVAVAHQVIVVGEMAHELDLIVDRAGALREREPLPGGHYGLGELRCRVGLAVLLFCIFQRRPHAEGIGHGRRSLCAEDKGA